MSKKILEKIEELNQELSTLEDKLFEKRSSVSNQSKEYSREKEELISSLEKEKVKNRKVSDILSKNIIKLEKLIEKEEKGNRDA